MIKGITQSSKYLQISGGSPVNPYIPPGGQSAGMLRYNTNMNTVEVYDGQSWKDIGAGYANVGLTHDAEIILDWAYKKMKDEEFLLTLPSDNPAVKIARENVNRIKQELKRAEEQLFVTTKLSEEDNSITHHPV
jgi:hypothetical protein